VKAGEYCEGCRKPRHKREKGHPNYNEKGLWIHSEGYKLKKAWLEATANGMATQSCAGTTLGFRTAKNSDKTALINSFVS
jgi:hypothetical protein